MEGATWHDVSGVAATGRKRSGGSADLTAAVHPNYAGAPDYIVERYTTKVQCRRGMLGISLLLAPTMGICQSQLSRKLA